MAEARHPYLTKHNLPEVLNDIVTKLLLLQPCHPMVFIIGECTEAEQEVRRKALGMEEGLGNYPDFDEKHSLVARLLGRDTFGDLFNLRTSHDGTLDALIQVGVDIPEYKFLSSPGCVATDGECYSLFSAILDRVIVEIHPSWDNTYSHELTLPTSIDPFVLPRTDLILSTFATLDRSVTGSAYPSVISRGGRRLITASLLQILSNLEGEPHQGGLIPTRGQLEKQPCELLRDWVLNPEKPGNSYDTVLGIGRDWPDGRLVWKGSGEWDGVAVWGCVREHIHVRGVGEGGGGWVPEKVVDLGKILEEGMEKLGVAFSLSSSHGSLVSNPANLGTSFTFGALLNIDNLARHRRFDEVSSALQITRTLVSTLPYDTYYGIPSVVPTDAATGHPYVSFITEYINNPGPVVVSYKPKMSTTIRETIRTTVKIVNYLVTYEELLQRGQSIDTAIAKLL